MEMSNIEKRVISDEILEKILAHFGRFSSELTVLPAVAGKTVQELYVPMLINRGSFNFATFREYENLIADSFYHGLVNILTMTGKIPRIKNLEIDLDTSNPQVSTVKRDDEEVTLTCDMFTAKLTYTL